MAASPKQDRAIKERLRAYSARQSLSAERDARRRRDTVRASVIGGVVVALLIAAQVFYFVAGPGSPDASPLGANGVPKSTIAEDRSWTGPMTINDVDLTVELDGAAAPQAVSSFLYLSAENFFDGLSCHRLTTSEDFRLLQCGDPKGDGSGGPDYRFGPLENTPADQRYPAGTIAMARQSNNATSMGSQFFIVYDETGIPNDGVGGYTVIGKITAGLDAFVDDVVSVGVTGEASDGAPASPITLTSVSFVGLVQ